MRAHIKNRVFFESVALVYILVSKNVLSVSEISAVNFTVGWRLFASSVKLFIASLFIFHREKMSFPNEWFVRALVDDISLNFRHKDVSKRYCHFCSHCGWVGLEFFPLKWKEFSFKRSLSISLRK